MMKLQPGENESYQNYIDRILHIRENCKIEDFYMERHHIIPRCLGGEDKEENLIWLFPEEHYWAHELLALENKDNDSLLYAWWMMNNRFSECIDAEKYAVLKQNFHLMAVENNSGESNPFYGKQHTEQHKKYISEKLKGVPKSEEHRKKLSQSKIGKCIGKENGFYGKHWSEKDKEKLMLEKPNRTPVQCVETGECFRSANEAERKTGINQGNISRCLKNNSYTAGGYHWVLLVTNTEDK